MEERRSREPENSRIHSKQSPFSNGNNPVSPWLQYEVPPRINRPTGVFSRTTKSPGTLCRQPYDVTMRKNTAPAQQAAKPSPQAVRRSVASSTALETGLTVQQLEQKLQNRSQHRFAHIKLAA